MGALDEYDVIILTIGAHDGSITGRTVIQRLIYFAQIKIPSIKVTYVHHYSGPFSGNIALGLDKLYAFSYLEEKNTSGTAFENYQYDLTIPGHEMFEKTKNKHKSEYKTIYEIVNICERRCNLEANSLSYAAKVDYILREEEIGQREDTTENDMRKMAEEFGWRISEDEVTNGIRLLEELKLV